MGLELIDSFQPGFLLVQFKAHTQVPPGVQHEGGLPRRRVNMIVVLELSEGD